MVKEVTFNPDEWQWKTADGVFLIEDIDKRWLKNIIGVLKKRLLSDDGEMLEYSQQEIAWLEEQLSSRTSTLAPVRRQHDTPQKRGPDYWVGRKDGRLDTIEHLR